MRHPTRAHTPCLTFTLSLALSISLGLAGCTSTKSTDPETSRTPITPTNTKGGGLSRTPAPGQPDSSTNSPAEPSPVVLPTSGRIHSVNPGLQFVVIDYTLGGTPPLQSLLPVYRANLKVGQVRLTGPERNGFVAADVVEGALLVDDEVRIH